MIGKELKLCWKTYHNEKGQEAKNAMLVNLLNQSACDACKLGKI